MIYAQKKIILIGAKAEGNEVIQYGGVLTLSNGLVDYARRVGFDVEIINTLRSGFKYLPFWKKLKAGIKRVYSLILLLWDDKRHGVIIFSEAGWSLYERIFLSCICRVFGVPDMFFIIGGWSLDVQEISFFKRYWVAFLLKFPRLFAASGENWVRFLKDHYVGDDRIFTIHYWLPKVFRVAEKPKVLLAGDPIKFIFVGWMIKEKGLYEILAALKELLRKYEFHFIFIGGGTLLEVVNEEIKTLEWGQNVLALGWVSPEQLEHELSAAHVFVLPSYSEGFPMSLIEAMTKGLPAICTDVGGISDSLKDGVNGFLIPPQDVDSLKKAMEFYICNPDSVEKQSLATLDIVRENHDADKNCGLLFNSLLGPQ